MDTLYQNISNIYPAILGYLITSTIIVLITLTQKKPIIKIPLIFYSFIIVSSGFFFETIANNWEWIIKWCQKNKDLFVSISVFLTFLSNRLLNELKEKQEKIKTAILLRESIQEDVKEIKVLKNKFESSNISSFNFKAIAEELCFAIHKINSNDTGKTIINKNIICKNREELDIFYYYITYSQELLIHLEKTLNSIRDYLDFKNNPFPDYNSLQTKEELKYKAISKNVDIVKILICIVLLIASTCIAFIDYKYINTNIRTIRNDLKITNENLTAYLKEHILYSFYTSKSGILEFEYVIDQCNNFHENNTKTISYKIDLISEPTEKTIFFISKCVIEDILLVTNYPKKELMAIVHNLEDRIIIGLDSSKETSKQQCLQKLEHYLQNKLNIYDLKDKQEYIRIATERMKTNQFSLFD